GMMLARFTSVLLLVSLAGCLGRGQTDLLHARLRAQQQQLLQANIIPHRRGRGSSLVEKRGNIPDGDEIGQQQVPAGLLTRKSPGE
ncbi:MAG TPA: hypothetical protein VFG20_00855, partial [Planctomycetaceae bacterium]|nr:hypothetical protein [Planctomycetaceae bacterium]